MTKLENLVEKDRQHISGVIYNMAKTTRQQNEATTKRN